LKKITIIFLALLMITACSDMKDSPDPQDKPAAGTAQIEQHSAKPKQWLIEVSDTKKGTYQIPSSNKSFDYSATLHLIAWKNGGDDIFGNYTGRWLIHFDVDYAKLSDNAVQFAGNVMVDRLCNEMSFAILPYSADAYANIRKTMPGTVGVIPLVKMDGMSSFTANETPVKREEWKAIDINSGKLLHTEDTGFASGEKVPVGVNLLTAKDEVTIDIPTYSYVWKLSYFIGKIGKNAAGKDQNELFNSILAANAKKMQQKSSGKSSSAAPGMGKNTGVNDKDTGADAGNGGSGNGSYTTDSKGRKGFDTDGDGKADTWYDKDGNMQSDAIKGAYVKDPEGHEGLDADGDGKVDMWMDDDGNTHIDYNKDGKMEIIKGEYSDGN
jgi:hypothetical protein